jgi:hypothetical protein
VSAIEQHAERNYLLRIVRGDLAMGASSKAMVLAAFAYTTDVGAAMPYDAGDWGRCMRAYKAAPPHLRQRMRPVMAEYFARLTEYAARHGGAEWRLDGVVWPPADEESA